MSHPSSAAQQARPLSAASKGSSRPLSAKARSDLDEANAKIRVQQFLDEWYYRILNSSLAKTYDQKAACSILLDIFELLGVKAEDREKVFEMEEDDLVDLLVKLMPQQMCDDFDAIALQLQTVVHSAARVRKAAEGPDNTAVQEIFDEGDGTQGIFQQILRASVVEASRQVARLQQVHFSWKKSMEARIARLYAASEEANHAMQQLVAIESQLEDFGAGQKQKSKQVLLSLAGDNIKTLMKSVVTSWHGHTMKVKAEKIIRDKYEKMITDAEDQYIQYKAAQVSNISGVLLRAAMEENNTLLSGVIKVWSDEIASHRMDEETKAKLKLVEDKLNHMADQQKANAKGLMTRMASGSDKSLLSMVVQAWVQFTYEYHKQREMEDAVKQKEQEVQAHMAQKKEDTKAVMNRMIGASDQGLKALMVKNWIQMVQDEKRAKEMEAALIEVDTKFKALNLRQTQNARGVQTRINDQINLNVMMRVFGNWLLETKTSRINNYYTNKLESKRRQLNGVQSLFKSFAAQLEENLGGDSDGSSRTFTTGHKSSARSGKLDRRGSSKSADDHPHPADHVGA